MWLRNAYSLIRNDASINHSLDVSRVLYITLRSSVKILSSLISLIKSIGTSSGPNHFPFFIFFNECTSSFVTSGLTSPSSGIVSYLFLSSWCNWSIFSLHFLSLIFVSMLLGLFLTFPTTSLNMSWWPFFAFLVWQVHLSLFCLSLYFLSLVLCILPCLHCLFPFSSELFKVLHV